MFKNMSLKEKVCQTAVLQMNPDKHKKEFGSIKNLLEEYPINMFFVGAEIIDLAKNDKEQIKEIVEEYREAAKLPILVAADGEACFGRVAKGCTIFPDQMSVGTARSEQLAYDFGKSGAIEAREMGINWNFAPVCDLNINRFNNLVITRSLSDDPELASRLIKQIVKGSQDYGLGTTGKHFPGDGLDHRNQHFTPTCNSLSMDEWYKKSGAVFKAGIDAGMYSIMIGHITLPAYQKERVNGHCPPATLSKELIVDLLKGEMGFKGVVISDALEMGGLTRWYYDRHDAEIKAFEAGIDALLFPYFTTIDELTKRLESGEIPMSRLEDALSRIEWMRNQILSYEPNYSGDMSDFVKDTSRKISERSSYIVSNELNLIPLDKNKYKKVRIVGMAQTEAECAQMTEKVAKEFEKRGASVEVIRAWDVYRKNHRTEVDRDYDLLVYVNFYSKDHPTDMFKPDMMSVHASLCFDRDKTVFLNFGSPYMYREFFETAETFVNSDKVAIEECIKSLYGEAEFLGVPSVKY